MSDNNVYEKLVKIFGNKHVIYESAMLNNYRSDTSFLEGFSPDFIVYPSTSHQIEKVVKLANLLDFCIIPVSSSLDERRHGDTIPKRENTIILNLSKMNKIISIDRKNRVVMVEPGVTFEQIIPKLEKKGLRLLLPLCPRANKSVVTTALERIPISIPRYHWDASDPLLCTEVVFGTGDLFRTGSAAGPGNIKQQKKGGQAQVNPMGPTHFSPFRVIQGAQGSLGIVTWASLKLELMPSEQKAYHFQSDNFDELLALQYELIKYRLCDEIFILNDLSLASLVKKDSQEIEGLVSSLSKWNLIFIVSGIGVLAKDKISYLEGDISDLIKQLDLKKIQRSNVIKEQYILQAVYETSTVDWRTRYKGGFQDIFFITNYESIPNFISIIEKMVSEQFGVYIQAINQGTSYHCEFDLYYDIKDDRILQKTHEEFIKISNELIRNGAFFNRPYGLWAEMVYANHEQEIISALKKVKNIFDPNNILNPGVLCFDD